MTKASRYSQPCSAMVMFLIFYSRQMRIRRQTFRPPIHTGDVFKCPCAQAEFPEKKIQPNHKKPTNKLTYNSMKQLSKLLTLAFAVMAMMASAQVPVTSGLLLDLNADSLNLINGATVSTWADTSGNGNVATNSSGTPTFVANGPGGHAYVGIKGSLSADGYSYTGNNSDYFNLQNTISGVQTIAMVVRRTSNNYYGNQGTNGDQGICMFGGTNTGSYVSAPWAGDHDYGTALCGFNADPAVKYGKVYINGGSGNDAPYTGVLDQFQVLYFTIQQGWGVTLTMDQIATDSQWNTNVFGMDIAKMLVYNRALTSGEQASVTSYLTAKYFPVTLSIAKVGNNVTLTWPVGTLQSSTNVTALYEDLSGATSPYTIPATNAQLFFRVKVQ
jgi:hypothetical protein